MLKRVKDGRKPSVFAHFSQPYPFLKTIIKRQKAKGAKPAVLRL